MEFNREVRLRVQAEEDGVAIIAGPSKGDPGEESTLQAAEHIAQALGDACRCYSRNTSKGDRVDMVVIHR